MTRMHEIEAKKDPVCGMSTDDEALHIEHQGLHYYFCSSQCQERFSANPHLYIGQAGIPSPKQQGMCVIKKRTIRLAQQPSKEIRQQLVAELEKMMGIKQVDVEDDLIHIQYDLLEATASQIEEAIQQSGAKLGHVWIDHLKRAFLHYIEETELDNLEHQHESHGCHRQ